MIQYEQTLHTHASDRTSEKLSDTQGKNKTTVFVCVVNCVLINYMALSFNVAQGMGAKKQTQQLFMHTFKRNDRGDITARYDKLALAKRMCHVPLQKMAKLVVRVCVWGMMIDKSKS